MKNNMKPQYLVPTIEVLLIELEEGFAVGSANVVTPNSDGQITDEWLVEDEDNRVISW